MKRQILHIDMNSYFATVEQQANPKLRGKPIAVLGSHAKRTIIVAASIEAKRHGIKTGTRIEEALEKYPEIIFVHGEPRKYSSVTKQFIEIFEKFTDKVEIFSIDEAFLDVTSTAHLFGGAENIAREIKRKIRNEIGGWISCSVGVAPNKFLAKVGSDLEKPDGLVIITEINKDEILLNLPLKEYCGIGSRLHQRLGVLGVYTTQDLRDYPNVLLAKEFGIAVGQKLKRMSFGIDNSTVLDWHKQADAKSFGHSRTLNKDVRDLDEIRRHILLLSEKVAKRMRDEGYLGQEVGMWLRFKNFTGTGKSMRMSKWTCDGLEISAYCEKILKKIKIDQPVRAIGVYVGRIQPEKNVSQSILLEDRSSEKILKVMDEVNNRYGEDVLVRAKLANTKLKEIVSGMGRKKF